MLGYRLYVLRVGRNFLFPETQTSTPHPAKETCPSPFLVLKEKERFTSRRRNRSAAGTIRGSSWKSKKRIKESISSEARRRQTNADHSIATRRQETFR